MSFAVMYIGFFPCHLILIGVPSTSSFCHYIVHLVLDQRSMPRRQHRNSAVTACLLLLLLLVGYTCLLPATAALYAANNGITMVNVVRINDIDYEHIWEATQQGAAAAGASVSCSPSQSPCKRPAAGLW